MTCYINTETKITECLTANHLSIFDRVKRLPKTFGIWSQRMAERKQLARLDQRLLKDIGITNIDANLEINKPFWRE